ncbi:unnamed protein product [Amoebophrya sp. A120]|nr:unnamed protein product [Amoebophrya sp. A120]|eukprot:GSA120T00019703001.1
MQFQQEAVLLENLTKKDKTGRKHVVHCFGSYCDVANLRIHILLEFADCDFEAYHRSFVTKVTHVPTLEDADPDAGASPGGRGPRHTRACSRNKTKFFMPLNTILHCGKQMAAAVAFIHSKNIVHFDLKPANFLMFENKQKIKLSDFGLAREVEQDKSHISRFGQCGTILYMAPEAFHQGEQYESSMKMKPETDIWSLGIILYAMIYEKPPHAYLFNQPGGGNRVMFCIVDPFMEIQYPDKFCAFTQDILEDGLADFEGKRLEHLLYLVQFCLAREVADRITAFDLEKELVGLEVVSERRLLRIDNRTGGVGGEDLLHGKQGSGPKQNGTSNARTRTTTAEGSESSGLSNNSGRDAASPAKLDFQFRTALIRPIPGSTATVLHRKHIPEVAVSRSGSRPTSESGFISPPEKATPAQESEILSPIAPTVQQEQHLSESMLRRSEDEEAGRQQLLLQGKMPPSNCAKGSEQVDLDPEQAPLIDTEKQDLFAVGNGSTGQHDAAAPDARHVDAPFWSSIAGKAIISALLLAIGISTAVSIGIFGTNTATSSNSGAANQQLNFGGNNALFPPGILRPNDIVFVKNGNGTMFGATGGRNVGGNGYGTCSSTDIQPVVARPHTAFLPPSSPSSWSPGQEIEAGHGDAGSPSSRPHVGAQETTTQQINAARPATSIAAPPAGISLGNIGPTVGSPSPPNGSVPVSTAAPSVVPGGLRVSPAHLQGRTAITPQPRQSPASEPPAPSAPSVVLPPVVPPGGNDPHEPLPTQPVGASSAPPSHIGVATTAVSEQLQTAFSPPSPSVLSPGQSGDGDADAGGNGNGGADGAGTGFNNSSSDLGTDNSNGGRPLYDAQETTQPTTAPASSPPVAALVSVGNHTETGETASPPLVNGNLPVTAGSAVEVRAGLSTEPGTGDADDEIRREIALCRPRKFIDKVRRARARRSGSDVHCRSRCGGGASSELYHGGPQFHEDPVQRFAQRYTCSICSDSPLQLPQEVQQRLGAPRNSRTRGPAYETKSLAVLPCGHTFCEGCIGYWTHNHPSCAFCRCSIPRAKRERVELNDGASEFYFDPSYHARCVPRYEAPRGSGQYAGANRVVRLKFNIYKRDHTDEVEGARSRGHVELVQPQACEGHHRTNSGHPAPGKTTFTPKVEIEERRAISSADHTSTTEDGNEFHLKWTNRREQEGSASAGQQGEREMTLIRQIMF